MKPLAFSSALLIMGIVTGVAHGETTGWSTGLFSSKTTVTPIGVQEESPKKWLPDLKMPDVAGTMKKATNSVTTATSKAWKATSQSTKQAWKKTTEVLDPFPDKKPVSATGASTTFSKSAESKGGFSSWFRGKDAEEDRPQTINQYLGQPRLK